MYSVMNNLFGFSRRLPVPEVPDLIRHLETEEDFLNAIVSRTGSLAINIYGEACPGSCVVSSSFLLTFIWSCQLASQHMLN